jgi:hypothetical protein
MGTAVRSNRIAAGQFVSEVEDFREAIFDRRQFRRQETGLTRSCGATMLDPRDAGSGSAGCGALRLAHSVRVGTEPSASTLPATSGRLPMISASTSTRRSARRALPRTISESVARLVRQHAKAAYDAMASRRCAARGRFQWDVNGVGDYRGSPERAKIDLERRLVDHAERRTVRKEIGALENQRQFRHRVRGYAVPEARREISCARLGAIHDGDGDATLRKRKGRCSCGTPRSQHNGARIRDVPPRSALVQVRDESVSVGISAAEQIALVPDGIDRSDRFGRCVAPVDEAMRAACGTVTLAPMNRVRWVRTRERLRHIHFS